MARRDVAVRVERLLVDVTIWSDTRATRPAAAARAAMRGISPTLSTRIEPTPPLSPEPMARSSSASVLATPLKTMLSGATPQRSASVSSAPLTTSAPHPAAASAFTIGPAEFAFTA